MNLIVVMAVLNAGTPSWKILKRLKMYRIENTNRYNCSYCEFFGTIMDLEEHEKTCHHKLSKKVDENGD